MKIKIYVRFKHELPSYSAASSEGMYLRADIKEDISLKPVGRALVKRSRFIEMLAGYEAQMRQRG